MAISKITTESIATGVSLSGNTVLDNLVVTGDLTVSGNTTTLNVETLTIEDKNIVLANVAIPSNVTADGAGITVLGATNKSFNWVSANNAWESSENVNLVSGKEYKIGNTSVLSSSGLGSGVLSSSLTSVGTLSSLSVSGNSSFSNISSSGNIGIGTDTTYSGLSVTKSATVDTDGASGKWTARFTDSTSYAIGVGGSLLFQGQKGTGNGNFAGIAGLKENNTSGNEQGYLALFTTPSSGVITERARISSSGNVGIGTNNPIQPLHVGGTGNIYVSAGGTFYSGGHLYIRAGSSGNLRLGANDTNDLATLDTSGNFYINSTNALGKLTVGVGNTNPDGQTTNAARDIVAFTNSNAGVFGIWPLRDGGSTYDGGLAFLGQYYNGSSYVWKERMRISSSGNIGIGTNSPAQKLEIRGNGGGDTVTLQLTNDGSHPARLRLHSGHGNWSVGNSITVGDALEFRDESAGLTRALIDSSGHLLPGATDSYDLGSSSFAWRNIYTNDLHLSNETKVNGNDVDGTTGNWTIQEGKDNLYIINNKTNKIYKFCLEEI